MKHLQGFYAYIRLRWGSILLSAVLLALVFQGVSAQQYQNDEANRRTALVIDIQKSQDAQTKQITDQTNQIKMLQSQNNELQQLALCMLQLSAGGDFTDRAECQMRVDSANAQHNFITNKNNTQQIIVPAPATSSSPTPSPSPKPCPIVNFLICA